MCMVFPPKNRGRRLSSDLPPFKIDGVFLPFVQQFKYLGVGHIVASNMYDEIRNMFIGINVFACKFWNCSKFVKV